MSQYLDDMPVMVFKTPCPHHGKGEAIQQSLQPAIREEGGDGIKFQAHTTEPARIVVAPLAQYQRRGVFKDSTTVMTGGYERSSYEMARGREVELAFGVFRTGTIMLKKVNILALPAEQLPRLWEKDFLHPGYRGNHK